MDIFIKIAQFVVCISLLVVLHELGHYIPAKLFKTRVEKFYLFFDPWFSLFKKKIGKTEFGVGWLPLGGYVKIAGMVDESMDTGLLKEEPKPDEFRAKPKWQRLIIMAGGVIVNALLAWIIYSGILMYWGENYLPNENLIYGVSPSEAAVEMGFKAGDKIIFVNGEDVERFQDITSKILLDQGKVEVQRGGKIIEIPINSTSIKHLVNSKTPLFYPRTTFHILEVLPDLPASSIGLRSQDIILKVNERPIHFTDQFLEEMAKHKNEVIKLEVNRNGEYFTKEITTTEEGKIGIKIEENIDDIKTELKTFSFFEAIGAGYTKTHMTLYNYVKSLALLFNPEIKAYKSIGGFISIGKHFSPTWDWHRFWSFTAFISIMLAFLNILPIPALDGGHILFTLYEIVVRKPVPDKFLTYAQVVGMVILFSLFIYANINDVVKLFAN